MWLRDSLAEGAAPYLALDAMPHLSQGGAAKPIKPTNNNTNNQISNPHL
jgi:hypothetical protein